MDTIPTGFPSSITGRWRIRLLAIKAIQPSIDCSGDAQRTCLLMASRIGAIGVCLPFRKTLRA